MIAQSKSIHNVTGSYSRWDLFTLVTRQEPYRPVLNFDAREAAGREPNETVAARIASLEREIEALRSELIKAR